MTNPYDELFEHYLSRSLQSARIIVPMVFEHVQPRSVVDVGCGLGPWLSVAKDLGATTVLGVDGAYIERDKLLVDADEFVAADLEHDRIGELARTHGRFDLCMCMEVAEHLGAARARRFVRQLCRLSDLVLFSAAIPKQGGIHHVNEQWPDYWSAMFSDQGYGCFDTIRFAIWEREDVDWWYIQNSLLFCSRNSEPYRTLSSKFAETAKPISVAHPRCFISILESWRGKFRWYDKELAKLKRKLRRQSENSPDNR